MLATAISATLLLASCGTLSGSGHPRNTTPALVKGPPGFQKTILNNPRPAPGWVTSIHWLRQGAYNRYYLLAQPAHASPSPLPLIVVLHGRFMTPNQMAIESGFLGLGAEAVFAYPAGVDQSWNAGYCCGKSHALGVNDVSFIETIVDEVVAAHRDTSARHVYLVGYSNGGRMAYRVACADPGAFAGIAAVEAVPVASCPSTRPVPIVAVAATGDPLLTIPANRPPRVISGHVEISIDQLLSNWRALNGCSDKSTNHLLGELSVTDWSNCTAPARMEFAKYAGGSHHWPEGSPGTPSAAKVIWDFFISQAPGEHSPRLIRS